ncbi:hypothetical protein BJV78DRAFT_1153462 [Lactifluus subvellereus]|nr:hypothetical protein BJV78DRAFT_1153462 [Lactifluus subvellereus]
MDFEPDEDGVIDLTIPVNDTLSEVVNAQLIGRRTPRADSSSSSSRVENRQLKKTDSLKENEGTVKRGSRSASAVHQGSTGTIKPPSTRPKLAYPLYNYADNIPTPKVIYIKKEEQANEMVASLNGQVLPSELVFIAIGLDLEWPFNPERIGGGKEGKVALVQLCDADIILLIQVSKMKKVTSAPTFHTRISPESQSTRVLSSLSCGAQTSQELIESSKVPKAGVNIRNDGMKLFRDYGILASNLVELGALACQVDSGFESAFKRPIVALAKVVSYCLHKTLDKGPDGGHDFSRALSDASNDVHSGFMVYKSLVKKARSSRTRLMPERYTADLADELGRGGGDDGSSLTLSRDHRKPPLHVCAYTLWRQGHGLLDICIRMGGKANPQSETVVISYILRALAEDPALPFSIDALISLVRLDSPSWMVHRDTIERWAREGRGFDEV